MGAAFAQAGGGYHRKPCFPVQRRDVGDPAVAHGALDLAQRLVEVVAQLTGVGHVAVDALLEGEPARLRVAVVALPVARPDGAFAPVLLDEVGAHAQSRRRALVEAREIAAHHHAVRPHRQCQCDVVVVKDAAVGADRDVLAGLLQQPVAGRRNVQHRAGLAAAHPFLFPRDADRAGADAHLDEVGARRGEVAESLAVHHVARADAHAVPVVLLHPRQAVVLELGESVRGIDAQHVDPRVDQAGYPLGIVVGVDPGAHHEPFLVVDQLVRILLVLVVVLAEHQVAQPAFVVDDRQAVEAVLPDQVVGLGRVMPSRPYTSSRNGVIRSSTGCSRATWPRR